MNGSSRCKSVSHISHEGFALRFPERKRKPPSRYEKGASSHFVILNQDGAPGADGEERYSDTDQHHHDDDADDQAIVVVVVVCRLNGGHSRRCRCRHTRRCCGRRWSPGSRRGRCGSARRRWRSADVAVETTISRFIIGTSWPSSAIPMSRTQLTIPLASTSLGVQVGVKRRASTGDTASIRPNAMAPTANAISNPRGNKFYRFTVATSAP